MSRKPPLVVTEPHDWAQYRMWTVESIKMILTTQDDHAKQLRRIWWILAGVNAVVTLIVHVAVKLFGG